MAVKKTATSFFFYRPNWLPRRYCKYAVTNKPAIVTGTKPNTIPESKGSTIIEKKINETEKLKNGIYKWQVPGSSHFTIIT